jgi:hypothetical protein
MRAPRAFFLILFALFLSTSARAQSTGTALSADVPVHEQPNPKSEILIQLEKGRKVSVLKKQGVWLQVKVQLDKDFAFTGWVREKSIRWKGIAQAKPAAKPLPVPPRPTAVPTAVPTPVPTEPPFIPPAARLEPAEPFPLPTPKIDPEPFFAPVPTPTPRRPMPPPAAPPPPVVMPEREVAAQRFEPGVVFAEQVPSLGELSAGIGYVLHGYKFSPGTGTGNAFSYNLPGLAFEVRGRYWFWRSEETGFRIGGEALYRQGFYRNETTVTASGGTPTTVKSGHSTYDAIVRVPAEYRFEIGGRGASVGLSAGFEYFKYTGDDANDAAGDPLRLYVGQTTMSLLTGVEGTIPIGEKFSLEPAFDLLALNFVSESPSDQSGTSPEGKLGFVPSLRFVWKITPKHHLSATYQLRLQDYAYDDTGSRIGTDNVTDGSADTTSHFVMFGYRFAF